MSSLTIRQLRKSFGKVEVLKGIDLEAKAGELIALVGPSGCGKSTLLAMIAGLESVTSGEIWIGDRLVNAVAPRDRDIAMVFQSCALYPHMTVRQNLAFGMQSRGIPKPQRQEAIAQVAVLLQIEPLLHRKPGQLSGGQRQRVAMGRALVRDPQLFLFDEPLGSLDARLRADMRTEIKKLHHRVGRTAIYATHDQEEAMMLASRVGVLHRGEVQQFDAPETVYNRPANMFVAGFMGSQPMNFITAELGMRDGRTAVFFPLAGGQIASLPLLNGAGERATSGRVVLGIRPEHLSRHHPEVRTPWQATLTAPVEVVEPTGAETMAVMRFGDVEIVGRFAPSEAPRMGEQMPLSVDMTHACLFDPATQRLI